jgi:hypothetical protein
MNQGKGNKHSVKDIPRWSQKSRRVHGRAELDVYRRDKRLQQLASHWTSVCLMEISEIPQYNFTCAIVPEVPERGSEIPPGPPASSRLSPVSS